MAFVGRVRYSANLADYFRIRNIRASVAFAEGIACSANFADYGLHFAAAAVVSSVAGEMAGQSAFGNMAFFEHKFLAAVSAIGYRRFGACVGTARTA